MLTYPMGTIQVERPVLVVQSLWLKCCERGKVSDDELGEACENWLILVAVEKRLRM
jgi:hypothetical protein